MFRKKRAYLDWAAAARVAPAAARAYARAVTDFGNPSSPHTEGRAAKQVLEDARIAIARELGMKADDILFTSGATEANNLAIQGVVRAHTGHAHILYLASAHTSTTETIRALEADGVSAEPLPLKNGEIDIEATKKLVRPETALVSTDFVCGETGTVWNTRELRHALPAHVLLHVDASQTPYEQSLERTRLGADLITLDAAKVGGMRGIGILAVPRKTVMHPLVHGGGQERGLRSGTESPALASAFAAALVDAREKREAFKTRAPMGRAAFLRKLKDTSSIEVNQGKEGVAHILNLSLAGRDTDYLVALLDEAGFAVSTKSACESGSEAGSRAVLALTGDAARARSTLRISWGPDTPHRDLLRCADALMRALGFLDSTRP